jgi:hypothetical protein
MAIDGNAYDGHTLEPQLEQVKEYNVPHFQGRI